MNCRQVVAHRDDPVDRDSSHLLFLGISVEQRKEIEEAWSLEVSDIEVRKESTSEIG